MNRQKINRVSMIVPIVLSFLALALVLSSKFIIGMEPSNDEGWQAHIFQILIAAQLPFIVAFIATTNWKPLTRPLTTLAMQAAGILVAIGSVAVLVPGH